MSNKKYNYITRTVCISRSGIWIRLKNGQTRIHEYATRESIMRLDYILRGVQHEIDIDYADEIEVWFWLD